MNSKILLCLGVIALAGASASANPVTIQPNESTSKDAFVYQFLPDSNFDSSGTFGSFGVLLTSGQTGIGHDTRSFLQFDLSGVTLGAGETALLNLYVGSTSSAGFGVDPSAAAPVVTDIYYNTSAWNESTLTWNTQPFIGSVVIDSKSISAPNQWVSFDITSLVQAWLANPSTNFGVAVIQDAVVDNGGPVVAVYDSSAGENKPSLQIVPEPATASLIGMTLILGASRCRRRFI